MPKGVAKKSPETETIPEPNYARGYAQGFDQGVKHIVTLAEGKLVKELKLASREALAESGKMPAWWIATLIAGFSEKPLDKTVG